MNKYLEFLNESKLQLLLEANITYAKNFAELLNDISDPISDKLKSLKNKDIDVKTNYISLDYGKNDYILFVPDDKFEKLPWKVIGNESMAYTALARDCKDIYPIGADIFVPEEGRIVEIVKNFTKEDIDELAKKANIRLLNNNVLLSHIKWEVKVTNYDYDENEFKSKMTPRECFYATDYIVKDLTGFKETPFKIGKFVTNFLTKAGIEFTNVDIERFVDKFKSEMRKKNDVFDKSFEIVKGNDIVKYYLEDNYASRSEGTLGSSCMRHHSCQDFFDIYSENIDAVSLVILKSDEDDELITGRALLWDAVQISTGKDIKFMDRIYVNKSNDIELFKQYAILKGFYYKESQNYSDTPLMFDNKVLSEEDSYIKVYVDAKDYNYYPYVDTVKYFNYNGVLSNKDSNYNLKLDSTDGGRCEICDSSGRLECYECDFNGNVSCYECDGSGYKGCSNCSGDGLIECPDCDGSGEVDDEDCSNCNGKGSIDCDECEEGNISCYECDGSGEKVCDHCGGEGNYDCPECS